MKNNNTHNYCGFLNVLKPPGMSSAQVVGKVRYWLGGAKVGHAGTLDPEASGVLPLMIGKATRLFDYMQEKEKAYVGEIAFGASTDTQDAQGNVLLVSDNYPDGQSVQQALSHFQGEIWQTPPMVSALKKDGKPLYALAREGKTVDIEPRQVWVHDLCYLGEMPVHGHRFLVRCSKGFYVRTLCEDVGALVDCPAHLRFLLRIQSGVFNLANAHTLATIEQANEQGTVQKLILPPETALAYMPQVEVPERLRFAVLHGLPLRWREFAYTGDIVSHFCLFLDGKLHAIAKKDGDTVKIKTWLG